MDHRPELGIDTFGDVTLGPDGRPLDEGEVIRHVVEEGVLADQVGVVGGVSCAVRGRGLLAGVELRTPAGEPAGDMAVRAVTEMLRRGFILLPEGRDGEVISFSPPLTIKVGEVRRAVAVLSNVLHGLAVAARYGRAAE